MLRSTVNNTVEEANMLKSNISKIEMYNWKHAGNIKQYIVLAHLVLNSTSIL